jgi:hypothetical protein
MPQQCCFPAATTAKDTEYFSPLNVEGHVIQNDAVLIAGLKMINPYNGLSAQMASLFIGYPCYK